MSEFRFYLGTHMPNWLANIGVPLFVCDSRMRDRKSLPVAAAPWALDSGGFTELQKRGEWTVTPEAYAARVRRYRDEIGWLDWAAPQDWMCEPAIIDGGWHGGQYFVGTHLSVEQHQGATVENFLRLKDLAADLPFAPVLQGFKLDDYKRCADLYDRAGIDLTAEPRVGLGSVCRRQHTGEIAAITAALSDRGYALHGFGVKKQGLANFAGDIISADSLAWSYGGRKVPGCTSSHKREGNCRRYALAWRAGVMRIASSVQLPLPLVG